jgi:hypothetical protein
MANTPYSEENQEFSNQAHLCARREVYPLLFNVPATHLNYPDHPQAQERDYWQGIDRTVEVQTPGLRGNLRFSVQERFRRPQYAPYRDMTITEYNQRSHQLGELYKMEAWLFVYGYYVPQQDRFIEVIACWVPQLMLNIARGTIRGNKRDNPRSSQPFKYFKFEDLERLQGVVEFRKKWNAS